MTTAFEQLETETLKLDKNERLILGQELLISALDKEETVIEKTWYDEAERRIKAYQAGNVKAYPAGQVLDAIISNQVA